VYPWNDIGFNLKCVFMGVMVSLRPSYNRARVKDHAAINVLPKPVGQLTLNNSRLVTYYSKCQCMLWLQYPTCIDNTTVYRSYAGILQSHPGFTPIGGPRPRPCPCPGFSPIFPVPVPVLPRLSQSLSSSQFYPIPNAGKNRRKIEQNR